MELQEAINQLKIILKVRKDQREIIKMADGFCTNCDEDIQSIETVLSELDKLHQENELAKQQLIKNCNIADDKNQLLAENKKLKDKIAIQNECFKNIIGLGFDYDGFYNSEKTQGDIEDMASLVDDIVSIAKDGLQGIKSL